LLAAAYHVNITFLYLPPAANLAGLTDQIVAELGTSVIIAPASSTCAPVDEPDTAKAEVVFEANL
jgi:hypothetical protein